MSLYMLILLGLVLTWEAHTCDGRPHSDIELSSNLIEKEEPVLRGGKNSISRADWKKMYRLSEVIRANKKLANKRREDDKKKLWKPVGTTTTSAPSEKPLYGGDQGECSTSFTTKRATISQGTIRPSMGGYFNRSKTVSSISAR